MLAGCHVLHFWLVQSDKHQCFRSCCGVFAQHQGTNCLCLWHQWIDGRVHPGTGGVQPGGWPKPTREIFHIIWCTQKLKGGGGGFSCVSWLLAQELMAISLPFWGRVIGFALINYLCITCAVFSLLSLHLHLLNNFCLDWQAFFLLLFLWTGGLEVRLCTWLGEKEKEGKGERELSLLLELCT